MTLVRPARPKTSAILGGVALAFGGVLSAAALVFGIVWYPLIELTFSDPVATLLALALGIRLGASSRLGGLPRFAVGIEVACAGLVMYLLFWTIALKTPFETPTFFAAALLLVLGYGVVVGAAARSGIVRLRRAL
ncbi:MAG TPA: hypothetical protein VIT43_03090 [Candidatus Dormibacteraeota bacterium]